MTISRSDLSPDQLQVYNSMLDWVKTPSSKLLTVGGYAGCLSGTTELMYGRGTRNGIRAIALRDLYLKFNGFAGSGRGSAQRWKDPVPTLLYSLWPDGYVNKNEVVAVYESGKKSVTRIQFDKNRQLVCTPDHRVAIPGGEFVAAGSLAIGSRVLARNTKRLEKGKGRRLSERPPRIIVNTKYHPVGSFKAVVCNGITYEYMRVARARLVVEAKMNGIPYDEFVRCLKRDPERSLSFKFLTRDVDVHHKDENTLNDAIENLEVLPGPEHARIHTSERNKDLERPEEATVVRFEHLGEEMTYDIEMRSPANNFVAGGIIVHNSGKSTLLSLFAHEMRDLRVAYVCFTGRASSIVGRKLKESGVATTNRAFTDDEQKLSGHWKHLFYGPGSPEAKHPFCGTIHRLLYRPFIDSITEELLGWEKRIELDRNYDLVVIDEASMCDARIVEDIQAHGVRILAVGDHGQLPPVMSDGSLVSRPMLRLEKIHRQAEGNPIIQMSRVLREEGRLARELADGKHLGFWKSKDLLPRIGKAFAENPLDTAVLCWKNVTRVNVNRTARDHFGYTGKPPQAGEPVIALRNYPPIYNGMRGIMAEEATAPYMQSNEFWLIRAKIEFPDEGIPAAEHDVCREQFHRPASFSSIEELEAAGIKVYGMSGAGKLIDFGYAMTVHKSQGSQFKHAIVVVDWRQDYSNENTRRLAYTAITRASERLTVLT